LVAAEEDAALRERHLAWYLRFVEAAEADRELDADRWRRVLLIEYDNLRAALEWGLAAEEPDAGRELAASLAWLWHLDRRGREGPEHRRARGRPGAAGHHPSPARPARRGRSDHRRVRPAVPAAPPRRTVHAADLPGRRRTGRRRPGPCAGPRRAGAAGRRAP